MKRLSEPTSILINSPSFTLSECSDERFRVSSLPPPQLKPALHLAVLDELLEERVESSRGRRNIRGVKQKMSNFPLRRRNQRLIPASLDFEACITIVHSQLPPAAGRSAASAP